jgi:hypothetical protein
VRFTRFILTPIDKPSPIHNFPNCPWDRGKPTQRCLLSM